MRLAKFEKCQCGTSVPDLTLHCHGDSPLLGQEGSEGSKGRGCFRPTEEVGDGCKQSHQSGMQVHLLEGSLLPASTPTPRSRGPEGQEVVSPPGKESSEVRPAGQSLCLPRARLL